MHKSSLLNILRTFSKDELEKFEDLVSSPYFNKKSNVLKLFREIKKYHPEFTDANLDKEKVWKSLFPKKSFNYGIMKNLIFELNKLSVKFIELENYTGKKFDSEFNGLEQYFSRKLLKSYVKKRDEIRKVLSKEKPSADLYHGEFILGKKDLDYLYANYTVKNIQKFDFSSLHKNHVLNFFSNYFLLSANIFFCQSHFKIDSEKDFMEGVLELYRKSELKNYYTDIFYYIFKISYDQRDVSDYLKLKELCYENLEKLNRNDQYTVIEALIFYCIHKTNTGDLDFEKERFQYHKLMDEHNLLLKENTKEIEGYMFLNTNVAACTTGEFEWAEKFINKYRSKLPGEERDNFVNLAYTHLYFKKGNFEKALSHLSKCDNGYGKDKANIKTYEMFLYYELGYYEELKNLVYTTRQFIRNDRMGSEVYKRIFSRFIEAVYKLNEYRYKKQNLQNSKIGLASIRNYVTENDMPHKGWLLRKLSELENK